ncbi:hypothetical protein [Chitinophaga solisilvae]|uniref:Uncharacterized protein n=1 Tax=Chitinophaga solisilvae TaxID=1233460 RepID=A0A3S1BKK1_9BACT|nr:hypothetical protein [Chitinophaga solisilvae]NSL87395.1 hypothetical protein [Chitinophaga solisilvae]
MEAADIKALWQAYDAKLERSMKLNLYLVEQLGSDKINSSFSSLTRFKIIAVIFGFIWIAFVGFLLYHNYRQVFFVISAVSSILFSAMAIAGYLYQIRLIRKINFSADVLLTQQQLAMLHISVLRTMRLLWLSMPPYTFFFITNQMALQADAQFWIIQLLITGTFTVLAIWLYQHISFENRNEKWVRALLWNDGGKSISRALDFMKEIERFKG